jgi:hypothetical protein
MGLGTRYREQLLECSETGFAGFFLLANQLNAKSLMASTMQFHLIVVLVQSTFVWCGVHSHAIRPNRIILPLSLTAKAISRISINYSPPKRDVPSIRASPTIPEK